MKHSTRESNSLSRREALRALLAAGSAAGLTILPEQWTSPVIEVGQLPAHAQASPGPRFFRLESVRQLTPCENHGNHHIYTRVVDSTGQGINDVVVRISWGNTSNDFVLMRTDTQQNFDGSLVDGLAVFAMFKGTYAVQIDSGASQVASGLTPDFATDEACGNDGTANSQYHISFEVVFVREG